jgi:hypothetical protein
MSVSLEAWANTLFKPNRKKRKWLDVRQHAC